jgi:hypothetical protein
VRGLSLFMDRRLQNVSFKRKPRERPVRKCRKVPVPFRPSILCVKW